MIISSCKSKSLLILNEAMRSSGAKDERRLTSVVYLVLTILENPPGLSTSPCHLHENDHVNKYDCTNVDVATHLRSRCSRPACPAPR